MDLENLKGAINKLKDFSKAREELLENIIKSNEPLDNFFDDDNYLVLAREWNSWYPSTYKVTGGCYFFNINREIIVIDPGFNTLEKIIKHGLDIRLIRHVFVTHFHPDHFENLSKLLTRLVSEDHKISVYLNTTTYHQFKIYMKDNTEFYELKPEHSFILNYIKKKSSFKIEVEVTKAYHREIGGTMNSVGLKFKLTHNQDKSKTYTIGFMSDTDNLDCYMGYYKDKYNDCDILIPHLGSIKSKKTERGYKHLYLKGVISNK